MTTYSVRAKRWERGWELHIDGVGVTQSHNLAEAESMSRSYISMTTGAPATAFSVDIVPEIGSGIHEAARDARKAARQAEEAQRGAAQQLRHVTAELKKRGLTGRDIARVLEVTPQRVSQLLSSGVAQTAPKRVAAPAATVRYARRSSISSSRPFALPGPADRRSRM